MIVQFKKIEVVVVTVSIMLVAWTAMESRVA